VAMMVVWYCLRASNNDGLRASLYLLARSFISRKTWGSGSVAKSKRVFEK
jgi:hypothetical protein